MANKARGVLKPPLAMKGVCDLAFNLRGLLADVSWEGVEADEIEASIARISEAIEELPFSQKGRRASVGYKLARAAAEGVLPLCDEMEALLEKQGRRRSWTTDKLRNAALLRSRLKAALGTFAAMAHGI